MPAGSLRRSSRLSAVQPQASPCYLSPRRVTRRALALTPVPASPSQRSRTPSRPSQTPVQDPESVCGAPQSPPEKLAGKASLCFTPAEDALPGGCPLSPRASISVRLPAEAENTSAVEVTNLVLPTFLLLHGMRPQTSKSVNLGNPRLGL